VENFSSYTALAKPSPWVAAHCARLVLYFSRIADSVLFVLFGNRIVVYDLSFELFRAADIECFGAGEAQSAGCPLAFVCAADFHSW
jgi:hypothetical protein